MFARLREAFAASDEPLLRRGNGRRALALFAFEFIVVLLGVLAAQMTQDWFADRADRNRAKEALTQMSTEAQTFQAASTYRVAVHECEMQRIAKISEAARQGQTVDVAGLGTPIMPMPLVTEWSEATKSAVVRHFGEKQLAGHESLALLARMISERQRELEDQWAVLRLIAPEAGRASEQDRAAVRLAAARIAGLMRHIDGNAEYVMAYPVKSKDNETLRRLAAMDKRCGGQVKVPPASAAPAKPAS